MPSVPAGAKKPSDKKPKSTFGKKVLHSLTLPSGSTIKVTRPGISGLVKDGVLESMDALGGIVQQETLPKAEGKKPIDVAKLVQDPEKMAKMVDEMDKIVLNVVAEPRLLKAPIPTDDDGVPIANPTPQQVDDVRDPEAHYIDYVEDDDKSFIMQFALGGSADLVEFRKKTKEALGSVPDGEAASGSSE